MRCLVPAGLKPEAQRTASTTMKAQTFMVVLMLFPAGLKPEADKQHPP